MKIKDYCCFRYDIENDNSRATDTTSVNIDSCLLVMHDIFRKYIVLLIKLIKCLGLY